MLAGAPILPRMAQDSIVFDRAAGFYDATLPDYRPPARALVVAFAFQLVGELPLLEHDVACDGVVTDEAVYLAAEP